MRDRGFVHAMCIQLALFLQHLFDGFQSRSNLFKLDIDLFFLFFDFFYFTAYQKSGKICRQQRHQHNPQQNDQSTKNRPAPLVGQYRHNRYAK